jgi:hypothetical protein
MLMGIIGQAALGLCESACNADSERCRTTVGGKLRWPQYEPETMFAISLLKHVVLNKSEGL